MTHRRYPDAFHAKHHEVTTEFNRTRRATGCWSLLDVGLFRATSCPNSAKLGLDSTSEGVMMAEPMSTNLGAIVSARSSRNSARIGLEFDQG